MQVIDKIDARLDKILVPKIGNYCAGTIMSSWRFRKGSHSVV